LIYEGLFQQQKKVCQELNESLKKCSNYGHNYERTIISILFFITLIVNKKLLFGLSSKNENLTKERLKV